MPRGRPKENAVKASAVTTRASPNGANLGFEAQLFLAADKLRKNLEPSDYKHVALGLIFLKHISNAFEARRAELLAEDPDAAEDPDEYAAENVFWVPAEARWSHLQANAKLPTIGKLIDDAMAEIEKANPGLKGVLPKDYNRPALDKVMLGELIDLVSTIAMGEPGDKAKDLLGRVYEYFLGGFAGSEGKRGGEFYTPRSVVRVLVEMLEPYKGRVYDPCCGSGGMFVQSEKFVESHGGRLGDIAIYGQESNYTTWRLAKMNLAVRGIDADIRWNNEGSFLKDELKDQRFDFILANPPFNVSDWGGERLREDARWTYGAPPVGNANYAWLQHILWHLAPNGTAGVVLANGSMSSAPVGRGRDPPRDGRGRCRGLHGRPAGAAVLLDTDTRLPLVPRPQQEPRRQTARPARRGAVHRRPQARHPCGPHAQGVLRRRHREDRRDLSCLAGGEGLRGRAGLLQGGEIGGDQGARTCADAGALCRRGGCRGRRSAVCGAVRGVEGEVGKPIRRGRQTQPGHSS